MLYRWESLILVRSERDVCGLKSVNNSKGLSNFMILLFKVKIKFLSASPD